MAIKLKDLEAKDRPKESLLDVIINRTTSVRKRHQKREHKSNRPTRPWESKLMQFQQGQSELQKADVGTTAKERKEVQEQMMANKLEKRAQKLFGPFKDLFA